MAISIMASGFAGDNAVRPSVIKNRPGREMLAVAALILAGELRSTGPPCPCVGHARRLAHLRQKIVLAIVLAQRPELWRSVNARAGARPTRAISARYLGAPNLQLVAHLVLPQYAVAEK